MIRRLVLILFCFPVLASGATNYWEHIQQLGKSGTPQGNPQLEAYLQSLTSEEMLQAAREYAEYAEQTYSEEQWPQASGTIFIILGLYGAEDGTLSSDQLSGLLDGVSADDERRFFRASVVRLLRQKYWRQLTVPQRREARGRFLAVAADQKAPSQLRSLTCRELELAFAEDYRRVIHADQNVRPLRNDKSKWNNLGDLIRAGEVRLEPKTRKALKALRDEIANITPTLTELSRGADEPSEVKDCARSSLKTLADLPVAPEQ